MADVLAVGGLSVTFASTRGDIAALRDVSLCVSAGEVLGVVGESGSGKSTLGLAILRLLAANGRISAGRVVLEGVDLVGLAEPAMERIRGDRLAVVFQDPMTTLNPVLTIATQMIDIQYRSAESVSAKRARAGRMLVRVGIGDAERRLGQHPHELSGGMRQRVAIAMAMMARPALLVADEPTTALDATLEVQILRLLDDLRRESGTAILLVSHHLALVAELAQRVAVMYAGEIVETGPARDIFRAPRHPYTQKLLECDPARIGEPSRRLPVIAGDLPDLARLPPGCPFAPRCHMAIERCRAERPRLTPMPDGRSVACHRAGEAR